MVERRNNNPNKSVPTRENEETKATIDEDSNSEEEVKLNNSNNMKQ